MCGKFLIARIEKTTDMFMNNSKRRCISISVLMRFRRSFTVSAKAANLFPPPTLVAVFVYLFQNIKKSILKSCEKIHKNPLGRKSKNRYQNASLTVEASVAFPVFFFAVMYLIQLFFVLRAELVIAEEGITTARDVAAYSYVAERLADGENAVAETLLNIFDRKIVQDVAFTTVLYARCDKDILQDARVAQGFGGIWADTDMSGEKTFEEIHYKVEPAEALIKGGNRYYVMRLVYRNWTGEGELQAASGEGAEKGDIVYMTEHGSVYHRKRTCSHIKIDAIPVLSEKIGEERNASGAKYYSCEFCDPVLRNGTQVFITEYGIRYHKVSTCSAIKRTVKECDLDEVKAIYSACSRCGKSEGGGS